MGPIASLMGVYYQQGKVTYSANIMAAAIKKSGIYTYEVRAHSEQECAIEFFKREGSGWASLGTSRFTLADADKGGLLGGPNKGNWTRWPRNMLFARAMSNGAKWYCPDVFGGITPYTPDELGAQVKVSDDGDMTVIDAPRAKVVAIQSPPRPEPTADEQAHAAQIVADHTPGRAEAEADYARLVAEAVQLGHPQRAKLSGTAPSSLTDDQLVRTIDSLGKWLDKQARAAEILGDDAPTPQNAPDDIGDAPF